VRVLRAVQLLIALTSCSSAQPLRVRVLSAVQLLTALTLLNFLQRQRSRVSSAVRLQPPLRLFGRHRVKSRSVVCWAPWARHRPPLACTQLRLHISHAPPLLSAHAPHRGGTPCPSGQVPPRAPRRASPCHTQTTLPTRSTQHRRVQPRDWRWRERRGRRVCDAKCFQTGCSSRVRPRPSAWTRYARRCHPHTPTHPQACEPHRLPAC
jgi:hypothetical protein